MVVSFESVGPKETVGSLKLVEKIKIKTVAEFELVGPNETVESSQQLGEIRKLDLWRWFGQMRQLGRFSQLRLNMTVRSSQPAWPNATVGSFESVEPNETVGSSPPVGPKKTVHLI